MRRRTLLKRIGAASAVSVVPVSSGAAVKAPADDGGVGQEYHNGDCHEWDEDPDCRLDDCSDLCPNKCCFCICP